MGLSFDWYYVLTKAESRLPNSKLHPNSGAPNYNIEHNVSDLLGDTDDLAEGSTNLYYTDARVGTYGDARYLKLDGSNADQTIDIGSEDFTTTGDGTFSGLTTTGKYHPADGTEGDPAIDFHEGSGFWYDAASTTVRLSIDGSETVRFGASETIVDTPLRVNADIRLGGRFSTQSWPLEFWDAGGLEWGIVYGSGGLEFFESLSANNRAFIKDGGGLGVDAGRDFTTALSIKNKSGNSDIGGFCIMLTNKTGNDSVAGDVVIASTGTADAVEWAGGGELMPIGVFLDSGISDGNEAWVVVSGIADVHMDANGCVLGDRIIASGTARRGEASNNPSAADHFKEIGHAIEGAGANGNARCVIHFL